MNELFAVYESEPEWMGWAAIALLVLPIATGFIIMTRGYRGKYAFRALIAVSTISISFLVAIVAGLFSIHGENRRQADAAYEARQDWVESHGVNLTKNTMSDLEFPSISEKPEADENYGLAQVTNANREVITVTLAWEDGEFVLYGTDGQPLEKLGD